MLATYERLLLVLLSLGHEEVFYGNLCRIVFH